MLHVNGNTLQKVKFKYLRVVFTSNGRQNKEIDTTPLVKQTQFCVSCIALLWLKGTLKHLEAVRLIGPRSDPHLWSWILGNH